MILQDLEKQKKQVIHIYEDYIRITQKTFKGKGKSLSITNTDEVSTKCLHTKIVHLQNDKFKLVILGEVKAGKSTFLNAFLKEEFLPIDINQCTSMIIEITREDEASLRIKYASGSSEIIKGNISDELKNCAALDDKYHKIPIAIINQFLSNTKGNYSREQLIDFLEDIENSYRNSITSTNVSEIKRMTEEYIKNNKENWESIVKKVKVGFPLSEDFAKLTLVDTPGINAIGRIEDLTREYVNQADAMIFLTPCDGLDNSSFHKFFMDSITMTSRNSLFLVLTKIGNADNHEIESSISHAHKLFSDIISSNRIFAVDSKLELFANKFENLSFDEIKSIIKDERRLLAGFADNDKETTIANIREFTRFSSILTALKNFAKIAKAEQMSSILELLERNVKGAQNNLFSYKAMFKIEKNQSPSAQLNEILRKITSAKEELKKLEQCLIEELNPLDASAQFIEIRKELKLCNNNIDGADNKDQVTTHALNLLQFARNTTADYFKSVETNINNKITEKEEASNHKFNFNINLDFEELWRDLRKESTESVIIKTYCCVKDKHENVYSKDKHLRKYKRSVKENMETAIDDIEDNFSESNTKFMNNISDRLSAAINKRTMELEELERTKFTLEDSFQINQEIDCGLEEIDKLLKMIRNLQGEFSHD